MDNIEFSKLLCNAINNDKEARNAIKFFIIDLIKNDAEFRSFIKKFIGKEMSFFGSIF